MSATPIDSWKCAISIDSLQKIVNKPCFISMLFQCPFFKTNLMTFLIVLIILNAQFFGGKKYKTQIEINEKLR